MQLSSIEIKQRIYSVREQRVMMDFDLAELYKIETKGLKRIVRRNIERFPEDFMFKLSDVEYREVQDEIDRAGHGGVRYSPFVFTEQGIAMLSGVLNTPIAIQMNILIMRTFVQVRNNNVEHFASKLEVNELTRQIQSLRRVVDEIQTKDAPMLSGSTPILLRSKMNGILEKRDSASILRIQRIVAQRFGIRMSDFLSACRRRQVVLPRHVAIYLVRKTMNLGFLEIGLFFQKDRSTILNAYSRVCLLVQKNPEIRDLVEQFQSALKSENGLAT